MQRLLFGLAVVAMLGIACSRATPTPDLQATVSAVVATQVAGMTAATSALAPTPTLIIATALTSTPVARREATLIPTSTSTPTPTPSPTATPQPRLSSLEAKDALQAYLLKEVSDILLRDKREEFSIRIEDWNVVATYQSGGVWQLRGPGMVKLRGGGSQWTDGLWELWEEGAIVRPLSAEAKALLQFLDDWARATPSP